MKGFFSSSEIHKAAPPSVIPRCAACGLFKKCGSPKMEPFGQGRKRVLVVGQAPGSTEDEEGKPFVGNDGRYLRGVLRQLGIDLDRDATSTNSIICRTENNRTPDEKEILYCRPNLLNTIAEFKPRVILTLGRSALSGVLEGLWQDQLGPLERWVGWQMPFAGYWICPTFHPSFLRQQKNKLMERLFSDHLEAAFAIDTTPPLVEDFTKHVEVMFDDAEIGKAIKHLGSAGRPVVVDYETNTTKPDLSKARIHSCALSNGVRTIAYPWTRSSAAATGELLLSDAVEKVAHNLKFEERWTLATFGSGVQKWLWDTMIATHCLDNRTGICSLKFQSLVRLGVPSGAYNEHIAPFLESHNGPYNRIEEIDISQLLLYGGMDAILEYRLFELQRKDLGYDPIS